MATNTKISFFEGDTSKISEQLKSGTLTPYDFVVGLNDNSYHYIDKDGADRQLGVTSAQLTAAKTEATTYTDGKITGVKADITQAEKDIQAIEADYLKTADKTALQTEINAVDDKVATLKNASHTHANKAALDTISANKIKNWDAAEQNAKNYTDTEIAKFVPIASAEIVALFS